MVKPVDALYFNIDGRKVCRQCGKTVNDQGLAKVSHASKCKPPKLKIWNGRGDYRHMPGHFYVCAPTKKLAVELLTASGRDYMTMGELNSYFHEGAWGIYMKDVTPEIGVWYDEPVGGGHNAGKPKRIL